MRFVTKGLTLLSVLICIATASLNAAEPPRLGKRTQGSDWPQFLGPQRDGKSAEKGIVAPWPAKGPKIVWTRRLGVSYDIGSVAYGRFYQFDKVDGRAVLFCLNAETGVELWKFSYPTDYVDLYGYNDGPRCSPLVDGDRVYLYGVEGMLHCLNATTGEVSWKVDTVAEFGVIQNFFGVGSTPIVEGNLLLVMVGGSPEESRNVPPGQLNRVVSNGSAVVAFDKTTGKVVYRLGDDLASYASMQTAEIEGRRWGFAFARNSLIGFDPQAGKVGFYYAWRATSLESVNASTPVVFGNNVFISETYGPGSSLLAISSGKPEVVWRDDPKKRAKAMQTHWNTPIHHEGYLYGSSGRHSENAELRCIDAKTGEVKWSEPNLSRTSLLYVDGHFIVQAEYGRLLLIKATPEKYDLVSEVELVAPVIGPQLGDQPASPLLRYPCWAAPILAHGLLYVRGDDQLVCMELIPVGK